MSDFVQRFLNMLCFVVHEAAESQINTACSGRKTPIKGSVIPYV